MNLNTNVFDLWVFYVGPDGLRFLLLHNSQEKADQGFNGGTFWQPPSGLIVSDSGEFGLKDLLAGTMELYGQEPARIFNADYVYTQYSQRRDALETVPVFASSVEKPLPVPLTWQHDEYGWFTGEECLEKLTMRGHCEGLRWLVKNVIENLASRRELWLF